jgi:uncharacterized protein DUF5677
VPTFADRLCGLVEARLPLTVESDGSEDDWSVVGPAILAAAARHLRAITHMQETFPSAVIGWQVVRSLFEYVATYAWIAADPAARTEPWLKYDYVYRLKLDDDFRELGETFLEEDDRQRIEGLLPAVAAMPDLVSRTRFADEAWAETLQELDGYLPEENRSFRRLYPVIYRSGSRFTHPSSHVVDAFVSGDSPQLAVGDERPLERDLPVVGTGILAAGLGVAVTASPALALTVDEIRQALSE